MWDGTERRQFPLLHPKQEEAMNRLARMEDLLKQMTFAITGKGHPEQGFIVRVDRLEQAKTILVWTVAAVSVSVIGIIVKGVAEAISR